MNNNHHSTVSVVMATYNGAQYIREQLDSIIAQTYPIFELIIQDDCSTDSTVDICREYEAKYPFVHVYVNTKNKGFKNNFQDVLSKCADTDYVALSDQDDIWTEDHIEHLVEIIGDKALACANSTLVDTENKPLGMTLAEQQAFSYIAPKNTMKAATILLWRNPYQGSTMLVSKTLLKDALPIPEGIDFHDSWLAILSCFSGDIVYSFKSVSNYRMHDSNVSGTKIKKLSRRGAYDIRVLGLKCDDRIAMIDAIESRVTTLSSADRKFLARMRAYFINDSILQKISNAIYLTVHFKSIFTL